MTITNSALMDFEPASLPSADDMAAFAPRSGPTVKVSVRRGAEPRWLRYVMGRLNELLHPAYEPDDDEPPPHPETIERALRELNRFMSSDTPTPSVVPTFDGGVQFVWHKGGWDIEVEVGPKETLLWAQRRDGDASWHGALDEHLDDIRLLLSSLASPA